MKSQEYLLARVAGLTLGIYCQDVRNVYAKRLKLVRLFYQGRIFRGIAELGGTMMQVIDLRRRIGLAERSPDEVMTVISFQTSLDQVYAVIVDEIVGMKVIPESAMMKPAAGACSHADNIHLLFPTMALVEEQIIHLMDATYLEKLEPVKEEAGELELF